MDRPHVSHLVSANQLSLHAGPQFAGIYKRAVATGGLGQRDALAHHDLAQSYEVPAGVCPRAEARLWVLPGPIIDCSGVSTDLGHPPNRNACGRSVSVSLLRDKRHGDPLAGRGTSLVLTEHLKQVLLIEAVHGPVSSSTTLRRGPRTTRRRQKLPPIAIPMAL